MSISIGNDLFYKSTLTNNSKTSKTSKLENTLAKDMTNASDEDLLESCKSFESYLVEQVVKRVKETVAASQEKENAYLSYFGDMMFEEIATQIADSGQLGIANQLYEAMKRNQL